MNILIVTPYFPPQTGGVVTFTDSLQKLLRQRGHSVYVLLQGHSHTITPCVIPTDAVAYSFYLRMPWVCDAPLKGFCAFLTHFLPTLLQLRRFIKEKSIDLVSLEYPVPYMYYFYLLRLLGGPKLVTGIHGSDVLSLHSAPKYQQWLVKRLVRRSDWLLAHSSSLMSQAEMIAGPLANNKSYIPYGIEPDQLRMLAEADMMDFLLPACPYILTVAKLHKRKALDTLFDAIQRLGAEVDGYRFVIVGDGPEEQTLKQLVCQLGIQEAIVFTGELQPRQIAKLYQHCEFFVLPSRSEPFGIVLLEAMTFGRAIVATNVGGIPEFVIDGYNGILVPANDGNALAEQIRRMIRDSYLRCEIGRNGLRAVEEKYDYQVIIEYYEQLFQKVLIEDDLELGG